MQSVVIAMAVFRVEKNQNYTTMSNYHLRDKELSLKAKGLLSFCLSLPESWDYSIMGLVAVCKENRDCIMSTLKELEQRGYLVRTRQRKPDGTLGVNVYCIFETPQPKSENPTLDNPSLEEPIQENPTLETPALENPTQISTNQTNTDLNKYEEKKEHRHEYGAYRNVLLTDTDLEKLKSEFPLDWEQRIERLSEYMASTGKSYKNHLATIRVWARRNSSRDTSSYKDKYRDYQEGDSL